MAKCAIFLADGFEPVEALAVADVLRRANNLKKDSFPVVDLISLQKTNEVKAAFDIKITADKLFKDIKIGDYDCLVLPGGKTGVDEMFKNETLLSGLKEHAKANKVIAAICAAPQILGKLELVENKEVTFYPGCDQFLDKAVKKPHMSTIADGNIITGSSIGGALLFALQIVDHFTSTEFMFEVHKTLVFNY